MPNLLMPGAPQGAPPGAAPPMAPPVNRLMPQQPAGGAPPMPSAPPQAASALQGMNLSPQDIADQASKAVYAADMYGMLARKKGDITTKDMTAAASTAIAHGQISAADAAKFLASAPTDQTKLRAMLQQQQHAAVMTGLHLHAMLNGAPPAPMGGTAPGMAPPQATAQMPPQGAPPQGAQMGAP